MSTGDSCRVTLKSQRTSSLHKGQPSHRQSPLSRYRCSTRSCQTFQPSPQSITSRHRPSSARVAPQRMPCSKPLSKRLLRMLARIHWPLQLQQPPSQDKAAQFKATPKTCSTSTSTVQHLQVYKRRPWVDHQVLRALQAPLCVLPARQPTMRQLAAAWKISWASSARPVAPRPHQLQATLALMT